MFTFIVAMQLVTSLLFIVLWGVIALLIRRKAKIKEKSGKPAGIWARFVCLGLDLSVIYVLFSLLAYRGSLSNAVTLTVFIFFGYFFFFWLLLATTPGKMLAGMKILPKEGTWALKVHQIVLRLVGYVLMIVGWLWALGKNKRALHDIFGGTRVVYGGGGEKGLTRGKKEKRFVLVALGIFILLFVSYFIHGLGESPAKYAESDQLKLVDANADGTADVLLFDLDENGTYEMTKNDINYDRIIDQAFYDLDDDGRVDAIDINNDGNIDGYDLNGDSVIDEKVMGGYIWIYLWNIWIILLGLGFITALVKAEISVESGGKKIFKKS